MKKLIVIPARGGSKGIPGKNIFPINGKPLLEYTIETVLSADLSNTDLAVSTDSEKIMEVARKYKEVVLINRPAEISGDKASTESALIHALDYMKDSFGKEYDAVLTLQATSPLRKPETLRNFIETYEAAYPTYDAMLSLNEDRSDFWHEVEHEKFERLFKNAPRRRQERKPLYIENSAYYITDVVALRKTSSVLGNSVNGFVISEFEAVDINEMIDIYIAEGIMKGLQSSEKKS